jgi:asparagine synthase (glutamine-hydrolysing)
VVRHAASQGISVLLSGWGGDEGASFDGRNLVPWLAGRGRLLPALRELRARSAVLDRPIGAAQVARRLAAPMLPGPARRAWRRLRPRREPLTVLDVRRQVWGRHSAAVADAVHEFGARLDAARSPHDYQVALLGSGHLAARCESWAAAGARAGVGYRYPLLDRRLVDFALSCPPACYRGGGWDRVMFRRAVEPFVPLQLAWNPVKLEPVLMSLVLAAGVGRRTHPRVLELAELEALQQEADDTTFALLRAFGSR